MWRINKNNGSSSITAEQVREITDPMIDVKVPGYIDDYFKTHPIPFDLSRYVRQFNPEYYVNVIEIEPGLYEDMAGMRYATDGRTLNVKWPFKTLYVYEYIYKPNMTIQHVVENKTVSGNFDYVEYITGTSEVSVNGPIKEEVINIVEESISASGLIDQRTADSITINYTYHDDFDIHTYFSDTPFVNVNKITYNGSINPREFERSKILYGSGAKEVNVNLSGSATIYPDIPLTSEIINLNNCPYVPVCYGCQNIKSVNCQQMTPITMADTFRNCQLESLTNVIVKDSVPNDWSTDSNAYLLVNYGQVNNISDRAFYGLKYPTEQVIELNNCSNIGHYALHYTEGLTFRDITTGIATVLLEIDSIQYCKNCIFDFNYALREYGPSTNFNDCEDCYIPLMNTYPDLMYCKRCLFEDLNKTGTLQSHIIDYCEECVLYMPNITTLDAQLCSNSKNCILLFPNLGSVTQNFCNQSFYGSSSGHMMHTGSSNLTYDIPLGKLTYVVNKTKVGANAWKDYANLMDADKLEDTYSFDYIGISSFHKTITSTTNKMMGACFCDIVLGSEPSEEYDQAYLFNNVVIHKNGYNVPSTFARFGIKVKLTNV